MQCINDTNNVQTVLSEYLEKRNGVPQGSVLRPIFFNLHTNDLTLLFDNSNITLFTDDISILLTTY